MSTRTHPNPAGGRWAWRDYLPTSIDGWLALRERVAAEAPAGIDVARFGDWMLAEMRGEPSPVGEGGTAPKYRKLLYELAQSAPPPKKRARRRDAGATDAKTALQVAAGAAAGLAVAHLTGNPALGLLVDITGIPGDAGGDELEARRSRGARPASYTRCEQLELVDVGSPYTRKAAA